MPFGFSSHCHNCCHVEAHLYYFMYPQLPTVLDRNSPGADLKAWGRVLSNVSQAVQKVSGLITDYITFLHSS